jgi:malonyl-CoA decarboxylase
VNTSFFSEMLQSIADRSRALIMRERREPARERSAGLLVELCEALLSGRGEASGVALADEILTDYAALTIGPRIAFFEALATTFGHDRAGITSNRYVRSMASPHFEIRPVQSTSPEEWRRVVNPT